MGMAGHVLGEKKLSRLSRLTGLPLSRAVVHHGAAEGVIWTEQACEHYAIDPRSGECERLYAVFHWATCSPANREALTTGTD